MIDKILKIHYLTYKLTLSVISVPEGVNFLSMNGKIQNNGTLPVKSDNFQLKLTIILLSLFFRLKMKK